MDASGTVAPATVRGQSTTRSGGETRSKRICGETYERPFCSERQDGRSSASGSTRRSCERRRASAPPYWARAPSHQPAADSSGCAANSQRTNHRTKEAPTVGARGSRPCATEHGERPCPPFRFTVPLVEASRMAVHATESAISRCEVEEQESLTDRQTGGEPVRPKT